MVAAACVFRRKEWITDTELPQRHDSKIQIVLTDEERQLYEYMLTVHVFDGPLVELIRLRQG